MYATIGRYEATAAAAQELVRAGRQLTSDLSKLPGFISCAILDTGDGVLTSISVYEDAADLERADQLVAQWVTDNLPMPLRRPPLTTTGEIIAQKGM